MRSPVERYVCCLLDGRRPKAFAASDMDVTQIRTAIELMGRRDPGGPAPAFVARLRDELAVRRAGTVNPRSRPLALRRRRDR